jgi:hypothetical protein
MRYAIDRKHLPWRFPISFQSPAQKAAGGELSRKNLKVGLIMVAYQGNILGEIKSGTPPF